MLLLKLYNRQSRCNRYARYHPNSAWIEVNLAIHLWTRASANDCVLGGVRDNDAKKIVNLALICFTIFGGVTPPCPCVAQFLFASGKPAFTIGSNPIRN